ncbi:MAG: lysophospholipid acyltransferase family protein [Formosimonas sp.]
MFISIFLQYLIKLLIGAYPRWLGCKPVAVQRIYFANHTSHIDTLAIWAALPAHLQKRTHPVAAYDYWGKSRFKRYVVLRGLNAIFIKRAKEDRTDEDPLQPLYDMLATGDSLIIFPEGTRNKEALPQPFKSGIFHLASRYPAVELVPVYLENLNRIMPKGAFWPVPLVCTARFGTPIFLGADESKEDFLERARQAVIAARAQFVQSAKEVA